MRAGWRWRRCRGRPRNGEHPLLVKDTGGNAARAGAAAAEALAEGASLILGPLRADEVRAAGAVAQARNVPLIGFSNTSTVAAPGVFLLSILPEAEVMRTLSFVRSQGRSAVAAIVPATDFGRIQESALREASAELNLTTRSVLSFTNKEGARRAVEQSAPLIRAGQIDALFLPDRATAPSFGRLLDATGIPRTALAIVGSADWADDPAILGAPYLAGAYYPAVDARGAADARLPIPGSLRE